jgi:hypothetical protein
VKKLPTKLKSFMYMDLSSDSPYRFSTPPPPSNSDTVPSTVPIHHTRPSFSTSSAVVSTAIRRGRISVDPLGIFGTSSPETTTLQSRSPINMPRSATRANASADAVSTSTARAARASRTHHDNEGVHPPSAAAVTSSATPPSDRKPPATSSRSRKRRSHFVSSTSPSSSNNSSSPSSPARKRARATPPSSGSAKKAGLKKPPPVTTVSEDSDENCDKKPSASTSNCNCCICMCDVAQVELATINGCEHEFCFGCIEKWSERENSCPLCKERFTKITRVQKVRTKKGKKNSKTVRARDQRADFIQGIGIEGLQGLLGKTPALAS